MIKLIIQCMCIILAGLMAGALAVIWLGYNPETFSYDVYLHLQQASIKALNSLMPLLGLLTILFTLAFAFFQKENKAVFILLLAAAGLLITGGLITKLGNQPINKIVMTWSNEVVPADWEALRNKWWSYHITRLITTVVAFCLISFSSASRNYQTS